jgi:hypothetical protein
MFTDSTSDLGILASEINTDPDGLGYAPSTDGSRDEIIADMLNAATTAYIVDRDTVGNGEIVEAVASSEWDSLTANNQRLFLAQVSPETIQNTARTKAAFATIFPAGTLSRANLLELVQRSGSRIEDLFGTGSRCATVHVSAALRG